MAGLDIDWTALDNVSLTYTTAPLKTDTRITGYPVVHLWVSGNVTDADFFVYLEEVDETGKSVNKSATGCSEPPIGRSTSLRGMTWAFPGTAAIRAM